MTEYNPVWKECKTRGVFLRLSLEHRIKEMKRGAALARKAYNKDYMGDPCRYLAEAYDEVAQVLERYLEPLL